jgi:hypothetical protein
MARVGGLFALLTAALVLGCAAVPSIEPVGERPKAISAEEWSGTWIHENHPITIKVLDGQKGLLQVAWVEEKEGDLKLESYQVAVRESGDWIFGNVKEKGDSSSHYWALIKKDAGQIIVWTPDPAQFRRLIQTGVLRGKLEGYDIILGRLTPDDLKIILDRDNGVSFEWQHPVVFFRVGK